MAASLLLVLMAPSFALAANTATFSSASPKAGSYPQLRAPKLSVTAYDRYGARRAGVVMYVDGKKVTYKVAYIVSGSWNPAKPDYRRFKLTYQVPASLSIGTHTVKVTVHDRRGRNSTYTWKFNVDLATDPATFSGMAPADGSSSVANKPRISATVADRWDVKGTGSYAMSIDGVSVIPSITYATAGNYRDFTIAYQVATALTAGAHSVTVSARDASARTTSQTWSFTVMAPAPVYQEMPVEGAGCADCHSGFPATHPTADCTACHGAGAPTRPANSIYPGQPMTEYHPGDASAHTLGCALEAPCHGGTGAFPHTIGTDCTRCHNAAYPNIPQAHEVDATAIKNLHASTPTFCTSTYCHSSSLTAEHYRHTDANGDKLLCDACHQSTEPKVIAAIANGDTACTDCHELLGTHPGTTTAHAAVGSCVRSGCHSTNVTVVHKNNCSPCHAAGVQATTNCGICHVSGVYHSGMTTAHTLSNGGCVVAGCHGVGLGMDAALTHKNVCADCHNATATPSLGCVTCHTNSVLGLHPTATAKHTPAAIFCTTSNCHGSDVAATHQKSVRGCTVCHAEGVTPSTTCSTCHAGDLVSVHTNAAAAHNIAGNTCIAAGCHTGTDAAALHNAVGGPGCVACHAVGLTPTLVCATCHVGTLLHAKAGGNHTSVGTSCIVSGCHFTDVTKVHALCSACHGRPKPLSSRCTDCHTAGVVTIHASADTSHTPYAGFCQTVCHANNVATIHESKTSCIACHNPDGHAPSVTCADCHAGTPNTLHSWAIAGHVSSNVSCQLPGCHATDVVAVHSGMSGMGCVACHAKGVTPSKDCGACHRGDVTSLHSRADAKHAVPDGLTCDSQAQCHASNVATIHSATASDCGACHKVGVTPSTNCSTCHAGTDEFLHRFGDSAHSVAPSGCVSSQCHSTDVSSIHNPGPSCLACHATGKTPGTNCAASGCHPADVTARHASLIGTSHNIPSGTCVQDGCHGSTAGGANAVTLHAGGPGCIACHADDVTASIVCADCHSTNFDTVHTKGSAYHTAPASGCDAGGAISCHGRDVVVLHTATGGPGCAACHAAGITATARCVDCHTGLFWGGIHAVGSKHTPADGTCVTSECHNTDVAAIHSPSPPTNGPSCAPCHRQGSLTINCTECHTIDMTPRHSAQDALHTAQAGLCVNSYCHGGSDSGANVATLHWQSTSSCAVCHANPPGPGGPTPSVVCANCHATDPLTFHNVGTKHRASTGTCVQDGCHGTTAGGVDVVALHAGGPGCTACHGPGKTLTLVCGTSGCHATSPATEHAKFVGAGIGGAHRAVDCAAPGCHTQLDVSVAHAAKGCVCHQAGKTVTVTCATAGCHGEGFPAVHTAGFTSHQVTNGSCVSANCHSTNVDTIHQKKGGPTCLACHPAGPGHATTADCATCHVNSIKPRMLPSPDSTPTPHPNATAADATHTVAAAGCSATGCHKTNIAAIHADTTLKCMACHGTGKTASKVCGDCHLTGSHLTVHEVTRTDTCVGASCHVASNTNLTTLHPRCATCHDSVNANVLHAIATHNKACSACHNFTDHAAQHAVTRTDTCVGASCHAASNTNLTTLHPTCATCHAATLRQPVKDAIAAGNKACAACHTFTDHLAQHAVTRTDTCVGASCHPASNANLTTIHPTCATCHAASLRQAVKDAITAGNRACAACHPFTDHVTQHAVTRTDTCVGASCHPASDTNLTTIHPTCATCHAASLRQAVKDAITAGNKACSACHPFADHVSQHAVTRNDGCAGAACHPASKTNLTTIHPTCATCHAATVRQTVKDAITAGNKTCTVCHTVGTYHAAATAKHTNISTTGCIGTYCHQSDVTAIHGRTGCIACHHPLPNLQQPISCTSCHPTMSGSQHIDYHSDCNNCHNDMNNWHGAWSTIYLGMDCNQCHGTVGSPSAALSGGWNHGGCNAYSCHY